MQGVLLGVPAPGAEPSTWQGIRSCAGGAHGLWAALVRKGHLEKVWGLWAAEKNGDKEQSSGV